MAVFQAGSEERSSKMGTKAYFMVNLEKKFSHDNRYLEAVGELEAMPEVIAVKPVSGVCDLLVTVDAPIRVILVANKIQAKKWAKSLHVLKVESAAEGVSEPATAGLAGTPTASA